VDTSLEPKLSEVSDASNPALLSHFTLEALETLICEDTNAEPQTLLEYVVPLDDEAMASILFVRVRQCTSDFVGLAVRVAESAYSSLRNSPVRFVETLEGFVNNIADHLVVWSRSISSDFSESCNEHSRM
tara:strand:- start:723 stop:1112 length:390 start_codon:yes stop_codon:yes gene_type:complete